MKKVIVFLLLLSLLPGTLGLAEWILPSFYSDTYYSELSQMYARLRTAQSPKLVILGGSSVAFGLSGALLEELLAEKGYHYTVCPFGLYAAVGNSAILDLSLGTLGKGDVVVLAMEPTSETLSPYFGATSYLKCAEEAPELLLPLANVRRSAVIGNYLPYLQERMALRREGTAPTAQGVYARAAFDDRCDLVYDRPGNVMALGFDSSEPIDLGNVTIDPDFAAQVNEYCRTAAKKGAAVYWSFAPMNRSALVEETGAEDYFTLCNETFICPVISDPERYILDSGWFYDSNFHLNTAGAQLRTALLAQDLLAQLGCYEPLDWTPPEMPPSAYTSAQETGDEDCFQFQPVPGEDGGPVGYLVSDLTELGKTRTSLTVPSVHLGLPVAGLTAEALWGAEALVELRIPATVESLPGQVFAGAPNLTRLILEHTDRVVTIQPDTFAGAEQVKIYVPSIAYPLYREVPGCEASPWTEYWDRIVPMG